MLFLDLLHSVYICTLVTHLLILYLNVKYVFYSVTLATKQRKEEEERNLTRRWFESTDERRPWLCTVWWWLRPRLWGLHVTLAPSPRPSLNSQPHGCTFSCCPVPPWKVWTMCCPFHFASVTRGTIPGSIQYQHSVLTLRIAFFCRIQPWLTHSLVESVASIHRNSCCLTLAGLFYSNDAPIDIPDISMAVVSIVT